MAKAEKPDGRRANGRPKGAVSKAKRDLASKAKKYADAALRTLAYIAANGEQEGARVSAATAILDRGYGKPHQAVTMDATVAMTHEQALKELLA